MLAARMVQTFDFSEPQLTQRLRFDDGDWQVGRPAPVVTKVDVIDLDGEVKSITHPGNASDRGKVTLTTAPPNLSGEINERRC